MGEVTAGPVGSWPGAVMGSTPYPTLGRGDSTGQRSPQGSTDLALSLALILSPLLPVGAQGWRRRDPQAPEGALNQMGTGRPTLPCGPWFPQALTTLAPQVPAPWFWDSALLG